MKNKKPYQKKIINLPPQLRFLGRAAIHSFKLPDGTTGRWESLCNDEQTVLVAGLTPEKNPDLVELFRFPCERGDST